MFPSSSSTTSSSPSASPDIPIPKLRMAKRIPFFVCVVSVLLLGPFCLTTFLLLRDAYPLGLQLEKSHILEMSPQAPIQSSLGDTAVGPKWSDNKMEKETKKNCALLFFGVPKFNFQDLVLPSIQRNILQINPDCDIFIHTYNITVIPNNARNGELDHPTNVSAVYLLTDEKGHVHMEDLDSFEQKRNLTYYRQYHHRWWGPCCVSTDNLMKQWHSIDGAWRLMEQHWKTLHSDKSVTVDATDRNNGTLESYQRVGLFRIDVFFVNPINISNSDAAIADFGHFKGGLNDRLFYGLYQHAKIWATQRFDSVPEYVSSRHVVRTGMGLNSEYFVGWLIRKFQIPYELKDICVWRTRGTLVVVYDCEDICGAQMKFEYSQFSSLLLPPGFQASNVRAGHQHGCPHLQQNSSNTSVHVLPWVNP